MSEVITAAAILKMNRFELYAYEDLIKKYLEIKRQNIERFEKIGRRDAYINSLIVYNKVINYLASMGVDPSLWTKKK